MAIGLAALQTVLEEAQGRLVRLALHRRLSVISAVFAHRVPVDRADREKPLLNLRLLSAAIRLRHPRQLPARDRAVRLGLYPAVYLSRNSRLQCRADRHGAGVDRIAQLLLIPLVPRLMQPSTRGW